MIEWKDVNKELPKGNQDFILLFTQGRNAPTVLVGSYTDYEDEIFNKFSICEGGIKHSFYKDNMFLGENKLTHWAYINKPNKG